MHLVNSLSYSILKYVHVWDGVSRTFVLINPCHRLLPSPHAEFEH